MGNWDQAVATLNQRFQHDGWRSALEPDVPCPKCKQDRCVVLTTIRGKTTAACNCCAHHWDLP